MAAGIVAACRQNMTPHHSHHSCAAAAATPADYVLLLFFANKTETHQPSTFKITIENKFRINLEVKISSTVIQYKSRSLDPDSALEKTIIAAANICHLASGLKPQLFKLNGAQNLNLQTITASLFRQVSA